MIEFQKLLIKNFRSFHGQHIFDFEDRQIGLHQVTGENGHGKSSLFQALYWILYGKTTDNLKAGNIHTWGKKGPTKGILTLRVNGELIDIERQWRPNKLLLNDEQVDDKAIENLIRFTDESFKYAVFIPQFGDMFFELRPAEKLSVFSGLLDLDYWLECSKKAQTAERRLDKKLGDIREEQRYKQGKIETLIEQAESYEEQLDTFDQKKDKKIAELQKQLDGFEKELKKLSKQTKKLEAEKEGLEKEGTDLQSEYQEIEAKILPFETNMEELENKSRLLDHECKNLDRQIDRFDELDDVCPTCQQAIGEDHIQQCIAELIAELESQKMEIQAKKENIQKSLEGIEARIEELTREQGKISPVMERNLLKSKEILTQLTEAIGGYRVTEKDYNNCKKALFEAQSEENPYDCLLNETLDKVEDLEKGLESCTEKTGSIQKEISATQYWIKGYKELRLFVVEDVLTHLEVQVNNHIHDLGLEGWNISFDVEKENKGGGVSKGFHVMITSPESEGPVPFETFSGGERQRLLLSGQLGLADLICQSYGMDTNLMICDEVTKHLNSDGITNLLDLLYTKAGEEQKQIYVIDHHSHDYGGFESIIEVTRDEKGSRINS